MLELGLLDRCVAGELAKAVVFEFPLRDEGWVAVNSPADRVPSHGTNMVNGMPMTS